MVDFEGLEQEKRLKIINAGFACFGKNGYKKTSIADIASAAGISKAAVFQYFGTKKGFYLYLFNYAREKILAEMGDGTEDFFESLRLGSEAKIRVMQQTPGLYEYLSSIVTEKSEDVAAEIRSDTGGVGMALARLFSRVDWSKLKPNVSKQMLLNVVRWVSNGFITENVGKMDTDSMLAEQFSYLSIIKKAFMEE